jgi:hypothetical protein
VQTVCLLGRTNPGHDGFVLKATYNVHYQIQLLETGKVNKSRIPWGTTWCMLVDAYQHEQLSSKSSVHGKDEEPKTRDSIHQ